MAEMQMTWKVRGVLKLYDSFTGRHPSMASFQVFPEEGLSVIKKTDGILVFVENRNFRHRDVFHVKLSSPVYVEERIMFPLQKEVSIQCLRMYPKTGYPAPFGTTRLYGHTWPGAEVSFCFTGGTEKIRLLSDKKTDDRKVKLYHPGRKSLEGFWIQIQNHLCSQRFLLGEPIETDGIESGVYLVKDSKSETDFLKMETEVSMVYRTKADENGNYMLFFKNVRESKTNGFLYLRKNEKEEVLSVQLTAGAGTCVDGTV